MAESNEILLDVDALVSGYSKKQVLGGVSMNVARGEIVAIIGHNGAGKSTLLKAIFGMIPIWKGHVYYNGQAIGKPKPREMIHAGVAYVPQGNRVFGDLTVRENLQVAGATLSDNRVRQAGLERALIEYPVLEPRLRQRAATLSGGEKQVLALAMSLVLSPLMILLDEPSLGLAPPLANEALHRIQTLSRDHGVSILIVEQKVRQVLRIAHRVYALRNGAISFSGPTALLNDDDKLREVYL
ncbi:MAG TPA: ABC transporter ATP-binding protein [Phycisphaerae bacterium]|nr:ABC transporter ATP-binding protein [Phycisphaerae bacterium]